MSNELPAGSNDLVGQTLGDYTLLRRLGSGGMADVFLAEQQSLKRKVAFKVLKPDLSKDSAYVQRFVREAQAAAALVQSSIVQIYEVGNFNGVHFIAQEYVPGRNLRQYIARHGAVETAMALNVLRQTALALQKAAEHGVIHRDIKPENIMIGTTGEVKVTDFGLARIATDAKSKELTQIGVTMGTPLYMSPEQVEGKEVDPRSDIYSLGITAFHMLAGNPPFDGDTALAVALKHVNSPPPSLHRVRPDVPLELCDLVERMIAKNPENRVQNAPELLRELRKVKIDLDEGLDTLAEKLATAEYGSADVESPAMTAKLAVTRQLQSVMQGNRRSWWQSSKIVASLLVLSILGVAAGFAIAQLNPPFDPFSGAYLPDQRIPRERDVVEQYRRAYWGRTPEHFKAVIEYFPVAEAQEDNLSRTVLYHRLAKQRLGEMYLSAAHQDHLQAYDYFSDLYNSEESALEFRIAGAAGLAVVFDQLADLFDQIDDQTLAFFVNYLNLDNNPEDEARKYLMEIEPNLSKLNQTLRNHVTPLLEKYIFEFQ